MPKKTQVSDVLRERLIAEVEAGTSLRTIEAESGTLRQSLAGFMRGEQSIRSPLVDKLAERYGLALKPVKATKLKR